MTRRSGGRLKILLIVLGIIVVILAAGIFVYAGGVGAVDSDDDTAVNVSIPQGSGSSVIVEILDQNGLIKNKTMAKIHARIGRYNSLQANTYTFNKTMTVPEMFKAINTGDFNYILKNELVVREGLTIPETAEALAENLPFSKDEIIDKWRDETYLKSLISEYWFITDKILDDDIMYPLEGYLYPETYFITEENPTIESVTKIMLDKMDEELTAKKSDIDSSGFDVHELLSMASMVEREASNSKEDMPKVAGVFINRLDKDMNLGSDVTVCYANQKTALELTQSELNIDSKYNTRKYTGLPIGPICTVNDIAIDSVLNYEKSDYLFFFAKEDGSIIYSKTNEEHDKAVNDNKWY